MPLDPLEALDQRRAAPRVLFWPAAAPHARVCWHGEQELRPACLSTVGGDQGVPFALALRLGREGARG